MGVPELEEYKFGFHDDVEPVFSTGEGLTEEVIREMSRIKGEPEWMLEFRLKSPVLPHNMNQKSCTII